MLGAIIGDIAGSRFEWNNTKSKDFELLSHIKGCKPTDDSIMSLAIAQSILDCAGDEAHLSQQAVTRMQELGRKYPHAGYGGHFHKWIYDSNPRPYNSWGNGSAMRVSACGFAATSLDEAKALAKAVTEVTHNHPEGIKGAEATAVAIYLARSGMSMVEIRDYIEAHYYKINFKLADIRATYSFDVSCQGSVPQALEAFFESTSFEDTIRNAISIGGDSDTIAAIAGGIAEAYYGIPADIRKLALTFLDVKQLDILNAFESKYGVVLEKEAGQGILRASTYSPSTATPFGNRTNAMTEAVRVTEEAQHAGEVEDRETTANALYNHLYEACNILRGPIDQDDYKSYVIPILFFKRISDVYDEETVEAEQQYGDDIEFYPEEELHTFIIPKGCHWKDVRNTSEDVGNAIVI